MWSLPILFVFVSYDYGRLSVYKPNDGFNKGDLACGGRFAFQQNHIAYRRWHRVGCGTKVLVCSSRTTRCVISTVRDAGPYGIYKPPFRHAVREGRWKVWTKPRPPRGWRWRAVADLSHRLWELLGRPGVFSPIHLYFGPRRSREPKFRWHHVIRLRGGGWSVYTYDLLVFSLPASLQLWQAPLRKQSLAWPWRLLQFPF